jgi:hypothetical protein
VSGTSPRPTAAWPVPAGPPFAGPARNTGSTAGTGNTGRTGNSGHTGNTGRTGNTGHTGNGGNSGRNSTGDRNRTAGGPGVVTVHRAAAAGTAVLALAAAGVATPAAATAHPAVRLAQRSAAAPIPCPRPPRRTTPWAARWAAPH